MTRLKTVSVSTKDIVHVRNNIELADVQLLKNVPIDKYRYVCVLGIVVSGEWLLPENVSGGVTISFIDKRLTNCKEAILGTYRSAAKDRRFQFKLVPNYSVCSADAKRNPWQVQVSIKGLHIEENWSPLTLEIVCVCMCANNVVSKGLKERILVAGDPDVETFEGVVDDFVDSVAPFATLSRLRQSSNKIKHKKGKEIVKKGLRYRSEKFADHDSFMLQDAVHDNPT